MINLVTSKNNYSKQSVVKNSTPNFCAKFNPIKDTFSKSDNLAFKGKYNKETLAKAFSCAQEKGVYFNDDEIETITKTFESNPKKAIEIIKACVSKISMHKTYECYESDSLQGNLVRKDIELVIKSTIEQVDVRDLMVPTFKSAEEGMKNTALGDVFEVEDYKNIFIRTKTDLKELKISKSAYCRLFPPVERYSSGQQKSGDCYLVAALNSMMTNPNSRVQLLSCFEEKEDGSIVVKLPNSASEVVIQKNELLQDLGIKKKKHMDCALGMQLLEYAYKTSLVENKRIDLESSIKLYKSELDRISKEIQEADEILRSYGYSIYDEHISFILEQLIMLAEHQINTDEDMKAGEEIVNRIDFRILNLVKKTISQNILDVFTEFDFVSELDKNGCLSEEFLAKIASFPKIHTLGWRQVVNRIKDTVNADNIDKIMKYIDSMNKKRKLERIRQVVLKNLNEMQTFEEKINTLEEELKRINAKNASNRNRTIEKAGGNGGNSHNVFSAFGLKNARCIEFRKNKENIDDLILDLLMQDDKIAIASVMSKESYVRFMKNNGIVESKFSPEQKEYKDSLPDAKEVRKIPLFSNHTYSICVRLNEDTQEPYIVATNPWTISGIGKKEIAFSVDGFKKYFSNIYVADTI